MATLITSSLNGRGESGQDHFAFEACGRKRDGVFLDIGCNEPIRWNNTYALEEIGWRGVGIDIEPSYAPMWKEQRRAPFALGDATTINFRDYPTLDVDYLSLDIDENTEGTVTLAVLENLFSAGMTFRCMTVEHDAYRHGNARRDVIRAVLQANGYKLAHGDVEIRLGNGKPFEDWWMR